MKQSKIWIGVAAIAMLGLGVWKWKSGESQRHLLETGALTLYSLDPIGTADIGTPRAFHHWKILGRLPIHDARLRARLINALYEGIEHPGASGMAACHMPRHGLRAVKDGRVLDVSICFACGNVDFHEGGEKRSRGSWREVPMSPSSRPLFDGVLRAAHIPLAAYPPDPK